MPRRNGRGHEMPARMALAVLPGTVAVLAIYYSVFGHQFVWDDILLFLDDPFLRSGPLDWSVLSRPVLEGAAYFRPAVFLTFFIEFHLFGVSPAVSHGVNLSLHVANSALVAFLALGLFERLGLSRAILRAAFAGVIYAVHPSMVEPVAWVSGRFDLMATFFCLVALCLDLKLTGKYARPVTLGALFFCALACKEAAVVLPLLLLLHRVMLNAAEKPVATAAWQILRTEWRSVLACGVAFATYMVLRIDALGPSLKVLPQPPEDVNPLLAGVLLPLNTLWFYLVEVALPFTRVNVFHPLEWSEIVSGRGYAKAVGAALVLVAGMYLLTRKHGAGFYLIGFIVSLLTVLNLVPLPTNWSIGHDRYLALPSIYWALALSGLSMTLLGLVRPALARAITLTVAGAWILMAASISAVTVPIWANELTLWSWAYDRSPEFRPARQSYVSALFHSGQYPEVQRVIERHGGSNGFEIYDQIYYGYSLVMQGQVEEGRNYLMGALPHDYQRWDNPGGSEAVKKRDMDSASIVALETLLYMGLAHAALAANENEEALIWSNRAVAVNPDSHMAGSMRAVVLLLSGDPSGVDAMKRLSQSALPSQKNALLKQVRALVGVVCSANSSASASSLCQRSDEIEGILASVPRDEM